MSFPLNSEYRLNKASPQANGLVSWIPTIRFLGLRDLINKLNGTLFSLPSSILGRSEVGQYISFDGTDDAVAFHSIASLVDLNQGTISLWLEPGSLDDIVFFLGFSSTSDYDRHFGFATNFGALQFRYRSTATGLISIGSPSVGSLYHLAATWNATTIEAFKDGISQGSTGITQIAVTLDRFVLGGIEGFTGTAEQFSNGKIADFRLYNRVLPTEEIWRLYAPQTRWDLYQPINDTQRNYFVSAAAPATGHSLLLGDNLSNRLLGGMVVR